MAEVFDPTSIEAEEAVRKTAEIRAAIEKQKSIKDAEANLQRQMGGALSKATGTVVPSEFAAEVARYEWIPSYVIAPPEKPEGNEPTQGAVEATQPDGQGGDGSGDMGPMMQIGGVGIPLRQINENLDAYTKYQDGVTKLRRSLAKGVFDSYMIGQGLDPDSVGDMMKASAGLTPKQGVSDDALRNKQARGAPQIEAPAIPDKDRQIMGRMIGGALATAMKNTVAAVTGKSFYAATSADPMATTAAEVSKILSTSVAEYQKKKDQISLMNAQLLIEHNNDIDRMIESIDARKDAAESAYIRGVQTTLWNMVADKTQRQMKDIEMGMQEAQIPVQKELQERNIQAKNVGIKIDRDKFNANMKATYDNMTATYWKQKAAATKMQTRDMSEYWAKKMMYAPDYGNDPGMSRSLMDSMYQDLNGLQDPRAVDWYRNMMSNQAMSARRFMSLVEERGYKVGSKEYNTLKNNVFALSSRRIFIRQFTPEVIDTLANRPVSETDAMLDSLVKAGAISRDPNDINSKYSAVGFGLAVFDATTGVQAPNVKSRESGSIGTPGFGGGL